MERTCPPVSSMETKRPPTGVTLSDVEPFDPDLEDPQRLDRCGQKLRRRGGRFLGGLDGGFGDRLSCSDSAFGVGDADLGLGSRADGRAIVGRRSLSQK